MSLKDKYIIKRSEYDAAVFDLDGVITQTQKTHAIAWKKMFDEFLKNKVSSKSFTPFDIFSNFIQTLH